MFILPRSSLARLWVSSRRWLSGCSLIPQDGGESSESHRCVLLADSQLLPLLHRPAVMTTATCTVTLPNASGSKTETPFLLLLPQRFYFLKVSSLVQFTIDTRQIKSYLFLPTQHGISFHPSSANPAWAKTLDGLRTSGSYAGHGEAQRLGVASKARLLRKASFRKQGAAAACPGAQPGRVAPHSSSHLPTKRDHWNSVSVCVSSPWAAPLLFPQRTPSGFLLNSPLIQDEVTNQTQVTIFLLQLVMWEMWRWIRWKAFSSMSHKFCIKTHSISGLWVLGTKLHLIIESQNNLWWKGPAEVVSCNPSLGASQLLPEPCQTLLRALSRSFAKQLVCLGHFFPFKWLFLENNSK